MEEGREPAFRLPFESVISPDSLVPVGRVDSHYYCCVFRDRDLFQVGTVDTCNRLRQRRDDVLTRPGTMSSMHTDTGVVITTHSGCLSTIGTGGWLQSLH